MEQIMNSDQKPKKVSVINTARLFFNKFPYKIVFELDKSLLVRSNNRISYRGSVWSNLSSIRSDLIRRIKYKIPEGVEHRGRAEDIRYSLFIDDHAVFENILDTMKDYVVEVSMPTNETHLQLMKDNHRIRVRPTLFLKKYRFKVNIKSTWDNTFTDFAELRDWLDNLKHEDDVDRWELGGSLRRMFRDIGKNISRYRYVNSAYSIYLSDEEDVMMLQLWLNNYYDSAEKVVLISEI
jgi:hypothetical protein